MTMSALFAKMDLKNQTAITVLDAPASFESALKELSGVMVSRTAKKGTPIHFAIAFATSQQVLDKSSVALAAAAEGDAILWIVYPKGTSKRYTCEFNRDSGWAVLGTAGFEPVRMVAIDEDWSALRFRRTSYIKTLRRRPETTISPEGQARTRASR